MNDLADNNAPPAAWLDLCARDELAAGELRERRPARYPELSLIVLCEAGGAMHAWLNVCPHQGRPLNLAPDRFLRTGAGELVCAAHGATFALPGGECIGGPCRGPALRRLPARLSAAGRIESDAAGIPGPDDGAGD